MNYPDFVAQYGSSDTRLRLIGLLKAELDAIVVQGWQFRAYVFGSVVNDPAKATPSDIDVLLSISKPFGPPRWAQQSSRADVQIMKSEKTSDFGVNGALGPLKPCATAAEMVRVFNESPANQEDGIRITADQTVELVL